MPLFPKKQNTPPPPPNAVVGKWQNFRQKYISLHRQHPKKSWALHLGLGAFLLMLLLYLGLYISIWAGAWGRMPDVAALQKLRRPTASEIYSADSVLLGRYFLENRTEVPYEDIHPDFINALVATEDARFFSHNGVDRRSQMRVLFKTLLMGDKSAGGGSTLTQQLVKNLYPRKSYGAFSIVINKQQESIIARRLEKVYTKNEILSHYLNTVSFGEQAYGIATAARRFFNKTPATLSLTESATLVGMLKATSYYNPRRNRERSRDRRNVVIDQMVIFGGLPQAKADSAKETPLILEYRRETPSEGQATHFRAYLLEEIKPILQDIENNTARSYNIFSGGLKIYTTLDSRLQAHAEKAVNDHLSKLQATFYRHWGRRTPWQKDPAIIERAVMRSDRFRRLKAANSPDSVIQEAFAEPIPMRIFTFEGEKDTVMSPLDSVVHYTWFLNAGFCAVNPGDGGIWAWVGGLDHRYFKYDHVTSLRQVGSTFKPMVYLAALESGRDPCEYIANELVTYPEYEDWAPENADGEYGGEYSMQGALTNSVNTVSVSLIMETGASRVVDLARKLGATHNIPREPAIALGAADLSVLDMTSIYTSLANDGVPTPPYCITRIENAEGEVIYQHTPGPDREAVISPQSAAMMRAMMRSVVDSGTARRLRSRFGIYSPIAGKTGTSQNHADGWFVGYTPNIVAGAWVGGEEQQVRFRSLSLGQGASMALPVFAKFLQSVYKDPDFASWKKSRFPPLDEAYQVALDCPPFQDSLAFGDGFWDMFWEEVAREHLRIKEDSAREARLLEREQARQRREAEREKRREERRKRRELKKKETEKFIDDMNSRVKNVTREDTL